MKSFFQSNCVLYTTAAIILSRYTRAIFLYYSNKWRSPPRLYRKSPVCALVLFVKTEVSRLIIGVSGHLLLDLKTNNDTVKILLGQSSKIDLLVSICIFDQAIFHQHTSVIFEHSRDLNEPKTKKSRDIQPVKCVQYFKFNLASCPMVFPQSIPSYMLYTFEIFLKNHGYTAYLLKLFAKESQQLLFVQWVTRVITVFRRTNFRVQPFLRNFFKLFLHPFQTGANLKFIQRGKGILTCEE